MVNIYTMRKHKIQIQHEAIKEPVRTDTNSCRQTTHGSPLVPSAMLWAQADAGLPCPLTFRLF
jgi:hypothetical protein